jgi:trimethylamine:corrinoid methyltransferase-like protein
VIDRGSIRAWQAAGSLDTFARAKVRVAELLAAYQRPALPVEAEHELGDMVACLAREAGMEHLPELDQK